MTDTKIITDTVALTTLMTWLSPAYPVGAYTYSHGLEWAVETSDVTDSDSLQQWLQSVLAFGGGWTDAVVLTAAWQAVQARDAAALSLAAETALALAGSEERLLETSAQGQAFRRITRASGWAALSGLDETGPVAYPIAVGAAAGEHGLALQATLAAYLHAFAGNLVSAGVRLIPLGETDGQRITAALIPLCHRLADKAVESSLDDLHTSCLAADIAAMAHETQYTRLFRS